MKRVILAAFDRALELFHQQTEVAHENSIYDAHYALAKVSLLHNNIFF